MQQRPVPRSNFSANNNEIAHNAIHIGHLWKMRPVGEPELIEQLKAWRVVPENKAQQRMHLAAWRLVNSLLQAGFSKALSAEFLFKINAYFHCAIVSRPAVKGVKAHPASVVPIGHNYPQGPALRRMRVKPGLPAFNTYRLKVSRHKA